MSFSNEIIEAVWAKGSIVSGYDHQLYRKDVCGAWIEKIEYGNRNAERGWEIDHITPKSMYGNDNIHNLRPLHWKNNASRQDGKLQCAVSAK